MNLNSCEIRKLNMRSFFNQRCPFKLLPLLFKFPFIVWTASVCLNIWPSAAHLSAVNSVYAIGVIFVYPTDFRCTAEISFYFWTIMSVIIHGSEKIYGFWQCRTRAHVKTSTRSAVSLSKNILKRVHSRYPIKSLVCLFDWLLQRFLIILNWKNVSNIHQTKI